MPRAKKTTEAATEAVEPMSAAEPKETPATPPRRRHKATAAAAAPEAAPEPRAGRSPLRTSAADEPESPEGAPEEASQDAQPMLPVASLLFQAPDPARARRRRRASSATTTPQEAPAAGQPVASARGRGRSSDDDSEALGPQGADAAPESAAAPAGKGRRRRKATAPVAAPEHVEEAAPARRRSRKKKTADALSEADAPESHESQDAPFSAEDETAESSDGANESDVADDASDAESGQGRRKRRRGGRGRRPRGQSAEDGSSDDASAAEDAGDAEPDGRAVGAPVEGAEDPDGAEGEEDGGSSRRRRRRRSRTRSDREAGEGRGKDIRDEVTALKGSTRLEAKRQRRREGRAAGRRRPIVTEAEFLARRESVDRRMIVREQDGLNQIAVLEDGLLVEHYVARHTQASMVGNIYIGRVQNVLPSMEAAFVDLGKGRNAVLYAGEVNWDAAGMEGRPRRIEDALSSGDTVLVQVTKDPIGHKGARLTSQIALAGRYLVLVPGGTMTGISRKLPDTERARLKKILKRVVPDSAGVIVRTAAEGASEEQLAADVKRLADQWASIDKRAKAVLGGSGKAPVLLKGEPELALRVVRDVFNEDFRQLVVAGPDAWRTISEYVTELSPDLADRLQHWVEPEDVFTAHRIDEQLAKGFDRKVWLPSGGTLVIDRTEAMTVIDVNTGRYTGAGGTLEETVTRNNLEAAEEIVRQLRLRDIGGMVVIDFVDMVLESNRDLVLRRLVECLGRDRTRHQVTEVTSLGLVQMTRKRVGQGLVEAFSTPCDCCGGRGFIVHESPVENQQADMSASGSRSSGRKGRKGKESSTKSSDRASGRTDSNRSDRAEGAGDDEAARAAVRGAVAQIAAATEQVHEQSQDPSPATDGD
ncbi:Rne/Rng family ribonuclease [Actinomyces gaoshouyii]|uniref:Ribonuclease E n=1 Tax=Actinomyces gaoshouyii TaxID=1960083 RepID=A0A8H9HDW2_9ACTO|nr:Rne/Rng family ribonuclease [Actinomyces gaoshouyii]ARD41509.1 ribonuclease E/G [Actinomyces gaoshouyii]GGO99088.1 ribonuclease E [Actinomyces gaoshouyii]